MRAYTAPADFVKKDGGWPMGPFVAEAPSYALVTAGLVANVERRKGDTSLRTVAGWAGVDPTALSRLMRGLVVPDVATVAMLEDALGVGLFPQFGSGARR